MNCANCGMVIGEKDTVCRHCSAPVNNDLKVEQLGLLGQKKGILHQEELI